MAVTITTMMKQQIQLLEKVDIIHAQTHLVSLTNISSTAELSEEDRGSHINCCFLEYRTDSTL